jgi:hypothetical protein
VFTQLGTTSLRGSRITGGKMEKRAKCGEFFAGPSGPSAALLNGSGGAADDWISRNLQAGGWHHRQFEPGRICHVPTIRIPAGREHVASGSGAWIEHELGRAAEEEATVNPSDASGLSSPAVMLNTLLLALVLGAGIAAIVAVRRRFRPTSSGWAGEAGEFSSVTGMARKTRTTGGAGLADDGGWENTLAEYKISGIRVC